MNLSYNKQVYALPQGVKKVEIGEWTKTREIDEIEDDEKKLNSEFFNDVKNINLSENGENVEIISNLYDKLRNLRSLKTINDLNKAEGGNLVSGNKILRMSNYVDNVINAFSYKTMRTWVGSDKYITWKEGKLGTKIITWPCYVQLEKSEKGNVIPVEWRMLDGKFQLSNDDINNIKQKNVQAVLGIETNDNEGFKLIIPFNDLISTFINGQYTHINYTTIKNKSQYKINENVADFQCINNDKDKKYCNLGRDNFLCEHTNNKHLDTNILQEDVVGNSYNMVGDISKYISLSKNQYTISLLIGQFGREGNLLYGGGITKPDLFLIEIPKLEIKLKPYIMKNDKKIYTDSNYKFSSNETFKFDVEIENLSKSYDVSNININLNFIKNNANEKSVLQISKDKITYNGENIGDSVCIYLNDNKSNNLSDLSKLEKNDKLTISSDKFEYTLTEYDAEKEYLNYKYVCELNYLNENTFHKFTTSGRLPVKPAGGTLKINVNGNKRDDFYLKLNSSDKFSNIKVQSNKTYTICNLDYNKEYKLSLINSSNYKPQSSQIFTLKNDSGYREKSITFNEIPKSNHYFTQRKIDEIIINR